MAQTEADKTFTQAKTTTGSKGPVMVGSSKKKKKSSSGVDLASETQKLREAQQAAAIEQIRRAEQEALLAQERRQAEVAPRFTEARRQTTAASALRGKQFAEGLAGQGLTGAQAEGAIRQAGALQRDVGALRQQESQELADIARTRADISRQAESQIAQTQAQTQAQSIADLINLEQQRRQRELQEAQLTGMLGGQQTLAGRQADIQAQQASQLAEQRTLQTEAARLGLQQQELQNLVNMNMGDLMAAMQQYAPGTPEYNALRVAREAKIRQQEALTRELADRDLQRTVTEQELQLAKDRLALQQQQERRMATQRTTGTGGTSTGLPSGYTSVFNNTLDNVINSMQEIDPETGRAKPLTAEQIKQANIIAVQLTNSTFGMLTDSPQTQEDFTDVQEEYYVPESGAVTPEISQSPLEVRSSPQYQNALQENINYYMSQPSGPQVSEIQKSQVANTLAIQATDRQFNLPTNLRSMVTPLY